MSNDSIDSNGSIHSGDNGQFTGHLHSEADPEQVLPKDHDRRCSRCGASTAGMDTWGELCIACADEDSTCPDCGVDTTGMNPAEDGCPDCHPVWTRPASSSSEFVPSTPNLAAEFIGKHASPLEALQAIAEEAGIAFHYQDRVVFESSLDRQLTDEEWDRVKPHLAGYDEWLDNSGAGESISFWRHQVLTEAGVGECAHDNIGGMGRCEDCGIEVDG